ncbi:hypothetical protein BLA29_001635 [Euroglyphus maynei]|uniref:Uncharacterized protein n=1 Tax=Euroglyphus maynei TaxID=6958 RepID=A0A1Y3AWZ1_EURMA|nr:hypothetical protein BLA29_001635 [Euroglyphus maynei]
MFNLNSAIFLKSFTHKMVKNQSEMYMTELSADSATKIRNTLCKALYFRLFSWIIEKINESIKTKPSLNLTRNNLSLYDFFGFENYYINFFEQLLANYLDEKIVQIFIDTNFRQKQEEYLREDIGWIELNLSTNDPICHFIDRPRTGIFSILNTASSKSIYFREEIFMKELNEQCGKDLHYIQINNPVLLDNDGNGYFLHSLPFRRRVSTGDISAQSVPQLCFGIRHFNENAVYSINGFIEKNAEHLNRNWSQFFFESNHQMLQKLFPEGNPLKKSLRKPITLANQFSIAIESMIAKLHNKEIHYVMCIKPNRLKIPNIFDDEYVYKQLSSHFIIEHGEFLRRGYVYCEKYGTFFKRFRILSRSTWPYWKGSAVNGVLTFIQHNAFLKTSLNDFNFGKTKIFIKHLKTFVELEELRIIKLDEIAVIIQKNVRKWLQMRKFCRMIVSQIKISRCFRKWKIADIEFSCMKQRRRYLLWLYRYLPSTSPIDHQWPPAPRSMRSTSELLRKLYHKWRCQRYRRCFDQINRNRMREKVTAMMLFKNRKASYLSSVAHPFRGDYIRLRQNVKWKRLLPTLGDVYVVFADLVSKITKRCGKEQFIQKVMVITTSSFIVLDGKTMQINQNVRLSSICKISTSPYMDNILVIHILTDQQGINSRALIFESVHLIELITKLYLVIQNTANKGPIVEISPEFQIYTGKETLVLLFKNHSSTQSSSSTPSGQVKIHRKSNRMEFSI